MKRILVPIAMVALLIIAAVPAAGSSHPIIKGSGVAQNDNSGVFPVGTVGIGGFNADTKEGVAKGKVKFQTEYPRGTVLSQLQGRVVCYEWTTGVPAGGQGWEIRFVVISSSGTYAVPVGKYGSIYVQDNGKTGDMIDETFDNPDDPNCGQSDASVGWEAMLEGGIKIKG